MNKIVSKLDSPLLVKKKYEQTHEINILNAATIKHASQSLLNAIKKIINSMQNPSITGALYIIDRITISPRKRIKYVVIINL